MSTAFGEFRQLAPFGRSKQTGESVDVKHRVKNFIGDYGIFLIFGALILFLVFAAPNFLTIPNLVNILRQSSIIGIIAIGMTYVMITSGIDLSVGSVVGLAGFLAATTAASGFEWGWLLAIAVGLAVGAVMGALNASMVIWLAIVPFLATLATMVVGRSAVLVISNGQPANGLSDSFQWIGSGMLGPIPVPVVIFVLIAVIADYVLSRTRFGRHVYAIGGNEESAQKVGINTRRVLMGVYVIAGLLSAIAGIVLSARLNGAAPLAGTGYELQAIAAVVIGGASLMGGVGTIRGTVLGVLLISVAMNGLNLLNVSSYYQQGIQGVILVLAVLLNRWKSH